MKLIIEIPDHIYEHAKNRTEDGRDERDAIIAISKTAILCVQDAVKNLHSGISVNVAEQTLERRIRMMAMDDFLAKTMNIPTTRNTSSDLYDSLLYAMQAKQKIDMEDKNMKRTVNEEQKDQNITITRRCDTSRGIFAVSQLEPTDMFALIDDEDQTVYMAVYEEDPKYKTKQAVVNMHNGNLLYLDLETKIHVYKPGCELRVGDFIWTSEGYN